MLVFLVLFQTVFYGVIDKSVKKFRIGKTDFFFIGVDVDVDVGERHNDIDDDGRICPAHQSVAVGVGDDGLHRLVGNAPAVYDEYLVVFVALYTRARGARSKTVYGVSAFGQVKTDHNVVDIGSENGADGVFKPLSVR